MNSAFEYILPAIDNSLDPQAEPKCYVAFISLKILLKLVSTNLQEAPTEFRTLQALEEASPLTNLLTDNNTEEIISKANITIVINSNVIFEPGNNQVGFRNQGSLRIPIDSELFVINGWQSLSSLRASLQRNPKLLNVEIQVQFLPISSSISSSESSIGFPYNNDSSFLEALKKLDYLEKPISDRERRNLIAKAVVNLVEIFRLLTDMNSSSLPPRSKYLFTFSSIRNATSALLASHESVSVLNQTQLAVEYWTDISRLIPDWSRVLSHQDTAGGIRDKYIHSHAPTLLGLGYLGATLIKLHPLDWKLYLRGISAINWNRDNPEWNGRVVINDRISITKNSAILMCSYFKRFLNLSLTSEEEELENQLEKPL